jgi:hypothetical protein
MSILLGVSQNFTLNGKRLLNKTWIGISGFKTKACQIKVISKDRLAAHPPAQSSSKELRHKPACHHLSHLFRSSLLSSKASLRYELLFSFFSFFFSLKNICGAQQKFKCCKPWKSKHTK